MGDISHDFRNGLWLVDRAMGKGNGLEVFWAQNLQTSQCVWSLKGKCVLTKQSHFIGAVESVIHKKFLNGCSNKLENTNQEGLKTSLPVWLRLEGISGDCLIPPTCSSRLS